MFKKLKSNVQSQFKSMSEEDLFVVDTEKNELFDAYISALPDDEKQSNTCNCCRSFLNQYGNIVSIKDGVIKTMWDFDTVFPYDKVPKVLNDLVKSKKILEPFLSKIEKLGTDYNHQNLNSDIIRHDHFMVMLPKDKVSKSKDTVESINGSMQSTRQVFERSLKTITLDAVETVLSLVDQNEIYRGKEFEGILKGFLKHKIAYEKLDSEGKELYVWVNFKEGGRVRNTAIGTLLVDISDGKPVDIAVKGFESIMAPVNYKRPTSLVTEKMVSQARDSLAELGLLESLNRRHATSSDIPLKHLLYVYRSGNKNTNVFEKMAADVPVSPKSFDKSKEITLDEFSVMMKGASNLELMVDNGSTFMSLIAPQNLESPSLFAWDNSISWTYQNNLTDVIKEKVKKAGGTVDGELRASLEWFNYDDLDISVIEPNGDKIYFGNKRSNVSDGFLDVDMNAGSGKSRTAVENIIFKNSASMLEGTYTFIVNNFAKRENIDPGFNIQFECKEKTINIKYDKAVRDKENVIVATFKYSRKDGILDFKTDLSADLSQREENQILTNRFHQVNMLMYSPNQWTANIGNKHLFFILDKARVDNKLRPFFNEYLKPNLQEHRKVFEIMANKLMVETSDDQLSGIGFSLTQRNQIIVKVDNKVFKVNI